MSVEHRTIQLRAAGDGRTFSALAVAYGVTDTYGTRWVKGCFSESLGKRLPAILWGHSTLEVVGRATSWQDTPQGPLITARLSDPKAVPRALQAASQLGDGTIDQVSVGFERIEDRTASDGVVEIVKARMLELSLVYAGSVPGAVVTGVRGRPAPWSADRAVAEAIAKVERLGFRWNPRTRKMDDVRTVAQRVAAAQAEARWTRKAKATKAREPDPPAPAFDVIESFRNGW